MGCFASKPLSPRGSDTAWQQTGYFESNSPSAAGSSPARSTPGHAALSPRGGGLSVEASSRARRVAPPSSFHGGDSNFGLQGDSYVLRNGNVLPSINTLSRTERAAFLKNHDPVRQLKLTDASVFFRVTERMRIQDGALTGHPSAGATIRNHLALAPNPYMPGRFVPAQMMAVNLPDPVLNVMFGPDAYQAAMNYASSDDRVAVKMTLGDIRRAGGGDVFLDVRAPSGQDDSARALIVTLPAGAAVPVTLVD